MKHFLFNAIGFASAISLIMLLLMVLPGALRGDFQVVYDFFKENPGSEPFVIFIMPVITLCGGAWIWKVTIKDRVKK